MMSFAFDRINDGKTGEMKLLEHQPCQSVTHHSGFFVAIAYASCSDFVALRGAKTFTLLPWT